MIIQNFWHNINILSDKIPCTIIIEYLSVISDSIIYVIPRFRQT